jgi:hypothetical protein
MSNRNLADAAPSSFSARLSSSQSLARRIVYVFLASDHRAAADIGYRHQRG